MTSEVNIVNKCSTPKTIHNVRFFLESASYHQWFVKHFAHIPIPLLNLLKESNAKKRKNKYCLIFWTESCQYSFDILKKTMISELVLTQPDQDIFFIIDMNISG